MNSKQKLSYLLALSSVLGGAAGTAYGQIQVAGELFVDLDATSATEGTLTSITNNGTLGGFFEARGGGTTIPAIGTDGSTRGIRFDGDDYMQLVNTIGGTNLFPPVGIVGLNATASIEVWVYNQNAVAEETMLSWGKRGGAPDGSNLSFNYGFNGTFGAVGRWGAPDVGWINAGGAPAAGKWHHLVYTHDGTTTRLYADSVLMNQEVASINTHSNTAVTLAAQLESNGTTVTGGLRGLLTLGRVRIHDGVLSDSQITSNYNQERTAFVDPPPPVATPLSDGPVHRWSFNEEATNHATDLVFRDSIGTAHGTVRGIGATFTGTRLTIAGGVSSTNAYGDLPNNLLSVHGTNNGGSGQVSIEGWIRVTGSRTWGRIFDFGSTTIGEITAPGGTANGGDYLFYSAQVAGDTLLHRMELRNEDPPGGGVVSRDVGVFPNPLNTDVHFVVTWDEATGLISIYENGVLAATRVTDDRISDINDVNVWLGRSNWTADQNMQGQFDEFRIYDHVLTRDEVAGNFQAGPNTLNDGNQPAAIIGQPSNVTTYETYAATFTVAAGGSPNPTFQWRRDGTAIPGATAASYTVANLTLADSGAVFSCVVSNNTGTPNVVISTDATLTVLADTVKLKNRYGFDESALATVAADTGGTSSADGELRGGALFNGTGRVVLNGIDGYVNLPNNLVTNVTNITIEAWIVDDGSAGWGRIFDFGNSAAGEDFAIGQAGAAGTQYMFLSQPSGLGTLRGAYTINGGGVSEQIIEWTGTRLPTNELRHVVWTSSGLAGTGRLYVDGVRVAENRAVSLTPAALGPTLNNWLGRAQFNDPFFRGQFEEFRIWTGAMTPVEVAASFAAGPNAAICGICLGITRGTDTITLRWPATATDYFLEESGSLEPGAIWEVIFDSPTLEGDSFVLTLTAGPGPKFYRLSR